MVGSSARSATAAKSLRSSRRPLYSLIGRITAVCLPAESVTNLGCNAVAVVISLPQVPKCYETALVSSIFFDTTLTLSISGSRASRGLRNMLVWFVPFSAVPVRQECLTYACPHPAIPTVNPNTTEFRADWRSIGATRRNYTCGRQRHPYAQVRTYKTRCFG
jgi:hypothetical protein